MSPAFKVFLVFAIAFVLIVAGVFIFSGMYVDALLWFLFMSATIGSLTFVKEVVFGDDNEQQ